MELRDFMDMISDAERRCRAEYHVTLGQLQATLADLTEDLDVVIDGGEFFGMTVTNLHSYRGYYADLAFQPKEAVRKTSVVLEDVAAAIGSDFDGYKGGDFKMDAATPLWIAEYGRCGDAITRAFVRGDKLVLEARTL